MQFFSSKLSSLGGERAAADAINRYRTHKKRAQEVRASGAEDACAGTGCKEGRRFNRQYRDQKQRAMEYLDSTAEQSTATRKLMADVPIVDGDGSHESEMTAWRHGPDTLSDSVIIADSLDRSDVLSAARCWSRRRAPAARSMVCWTLVVHATMVNQRRPTAPRGLHLRLLPPPPPTAPPPPAPRETPVDGGTLFQCRHWHLLQIVRHRAPRPE